MLNIISGQLFSAPWPHILSDALRRRRLSKLNLSLCQNVKYTPIGNRVIMQQWILCFYLSVVSMSVTVILMINITFVTLVVLLIWNIELSKHYQNGDTLIYHKTDYSKLILWILSIKFDLESLFLYNHRGI